jgi:hypothetical protein
MRSSHKGWVLFGMLSLASCGAIAACTATTTFEDLGGNEDAGDQRDATSTDAARDVAVDRGVPVQDARPDNVIIPPADAGSDVRDAAREAEAAAPLPPEGSPCSPVNTTQNQTCGLCGTQTRVCLNTGSDAGATWQAWGACLNEVRGGCVPGTSGTESCGFCGTRSRVCQANCTYANGACTGEAPPATRCTPGELEFTEGLSCDAGGRERTCGTGSIDAGGCSWGSYGSCTQPSPDMTIASTIGGTVTTEFTARATNGGRETPDIDWISSQPDKCPITALSGEITSYKFIRVKNPTGQRAFISMWVTPGANATTGEDTIMAAYSGMSYPGNLLACVGHADDECIAPGDGGAYPGACEDGQSGVFFDGVLDGGGTGIPIEANSMVVVYVAGFYGTTDFDFKLNLKTEALQ